MSIRHPFLPDKSLDGLFHILEDVPGDAAGGAAQRGQGLRGIELHHKDEVLGIVMGFRVTAAPLQKHEANAVFQRSPEPVFGGLAVQLLQEASCFCFCQFCQTAGEPFSDLRLCGQFENCGQLRVRGFQTVKLRQLTAQLLLHPGLYLPDGSLMPLPAVGVGDIEDIAQLVVARIIHQKGDALAASVDPPPELVPHAHLRTGGGIRPLGVDEELIPEAVFMIPGGGGEEVHVGLAA